MIGIFRTKSARIVLAMLVFLLSILAVLVAIMGCGGSDLAEVAEVAEGLQPAQSASPTVVLPTTPEFPTTSPDTVSPAVTPAPSCTTPDTVPLPTQPSPSVTVYLDPSSQGAMRGEEISVSIKAQTSDQAISGSDLQMRFDPRVFEVVALSSDEVLGGDPVVGMDAIDNQNGTLRYAVARKGNESLSSNPESLAVIRFQIAASATVGRHELRLESVTLTDQRFNIINEVSIQNGFVEIGG